MKLQQNSNRAWNTPSKPWSKRNTLLNTKNLPILHAAAFQLPCFFLLVPSSTFPIILPVNYRIPVINLVVGLFLDLHWLYQCETRKALPPAMLRNLIGLLTMGVTYLTQLLISKKLRMSQLFLILLRCLCLFFQPCDRFMSHQSPVSQVANGCRSKLLQNHFWVRTKGKSACKPQTSGILPKKPAILRRADGPRASDRSSGHGYTIRATHTWNSKADGEKTQWWHLAARTASRAACTAGKAGVSKSWSSSLGCLCSPSKSLLLFLQERLSLS